MTYYPIAVKLKTGDNRLNLKATNISVKSIESKYRTNNSGKKVLEGYYYTLAISSTLDPGAYAGPIENIIRMKNVYNGEELGTVDAGTHDFSVNKNFYKEITTPLMSSSGVTFEYEVNPVKSDGHHNPTEKGYLDNVVRTGDVNLTAAGLKVYVTNSGKTLNIDWEATKVGTFSGITDGEVVVKNINTGQVFLKENIAHVAFSHVDAGGDPYAKGSTTATINAPLQDLVVYFRVNYPNGYPGNKPTQETTFGDNEIMAYVVAGEIIEGSLWMDFWRICMVKYN